jgi:hypothetical protein
MNNPSVTILFLVLALVRVAPGAELQGVELFAEKNFDVHCSDSPDPRLATEIRRWVDRAADAVTNYYQRYPVKHVDIYLKLRLGSGVGGGHAEGWNGPRIYVSVGRNTSRAVFDDDWVLTHEMVHLAFPSVPRYNHWIEEGLATYVEPIARARVGQLTPERIWGDMLAGMPNGLPQAGDGGLDHTPTWGRTYWGGALFCLTADVEIRRQTHGQKGLEDAVRGILNKVGNIELDASLIDLLRVGDETTGVSVLVPLYEDWKDKPVTPDLAKFWQELGVQSRDGKTALDDNAPLAPERRAITTGRGT